MLSKFCRRSAVEDDQPTAKEINEQIEREIALHQQRLKQTVKVLLLGASETGKSTVLKQMRVLHDNGFTKNEFVLYKHLVLSQTVSSMLIVCEELERAGGVFAERSTKAFHEALVQQHESNQYSNTSYVLNDLGRMCVIEISKDANFKIFFEAYGSTFNGACGKFIRNSPRIVAEYYTPTEADLVHVRVRTTGINEITFKAKNLDFIAVDVAGVQTARKRWLETFEGVDCVMFLTATSDFNLSMREDPTKNRLKDSLELFKDIYRSQWFAKSHFALFLNKRDVLSDKLKSMQLRDYCANYTGDNTYQDASRYMEYTFRRCETSERKIYCHHTCATDTDQMSFVINACFNEIRQKLLNSHMIMA